MEDVMNIEIALFSNNVLVNWPCAICGENCGREEVVFGIAQSPASFAFVCDRCGERHDPKLASAKRAWLEAEAARDAEASQQRWDALPAAVRQRLEAEAADAPF
jgi:hypothetical protein